MKIELNNILNITQVGNNYVATALEIVIFIFAIYWSSRVFDAIKEAAYRRLRDCEENNKDLKLAIWFISITISLESFFIITILITSTVNHLSEFILH